MMTRQTDMFFFNSSSSSSTSPPHLSSSNSSLHPSLLSCLRDRTGLFILTAYSTTSVLLLLPLSILLLCEARLRWRKQRSVAAAAPMSHSDFFTYNMLAMELLRALGSWLICGGVFSDISSLIMAGVYLFCISSSGQTLFHMLTCVERYLAVVHPITYLGLRQGGGVRIRNVSTGCVWLMCLAGVGILEELIRNFSNFSATSFWIIALVVVSFCSLSVLCALIRPRPGDRGGDRERVDQSKQRAFNTISAIMGVLLFRLVGDICCIVTFSHSELSYQHKCAVMMSLPWFSVPSSLVLPLLFLHRAGRLPGCTHNPDSG